jgi:hypothetical protein
LAHAYLFITPLHKKLLPLEHYDSLTKQQCNLVEKILRHINDKYFVNPITLTESDFTELKNIDIKTRIFLFNDISCKIAPSQRSVMERAAYEIIRNVLSNNDTIIATALSLTLLEHSDPDRSFPCVTLALLYMLHNFYAECEKALVMEQESQPLA